MSKTAKDDEVMNLRVSATVQFGLPADEGNGIMYNIHFRNEFGGEWAVSHNYYQLARLDHLVTTQLEAMKSVYYPLVSRDILDRLKADGNSPRDRMVFVEHFRSLLEKWIHAVIANCHLLDAVNVKVVERFFQLPFPSPDVKTYQFSTISTFDNGAAINDSSWELKSAYSAQTSMTKTTIASKSSRTTSVSTSLGQGRIQRMSIDAQGTDGVWACCNDDQVTMKTHVRRGPTIEGVLEYEVMLSVPGKKPRMSKRRYGVFRTLFHALKKCKVVMLVPFPGKQSTVKVDEVFLSKRTYLLDAWFREACTLYMAMTMEQKQLMKEFLQFNLSTGSDIYLHDKLAKGMVAAPRAPIADTKGMRSGGESDERPSFDNDLFERTNSFKFLDDEKAELKSSGFFGDKNKKTGAKMKEDPPVVRPSAIRIYELTGVSELLRVAKPLDAAGLSVISENRSSSRSQASSAFANNPLMETMSMSSRLDEKFLSQRQNNYEDNGQQDVFASSGNTLYKKSFYETCCTIS